MGITAVIFKAKHLTQICDLLHRAQLLMGQHGGGRRVGLARTGVYQVGKTVTSGAGWGGGRGIKGLRIFARK